MGKSKVEFKRWVSIRDKSWPYQVFRKHTQELNRMMWANEASFKYTYANLKKDGAKWTDKASDYLVFAIDQGKEVFNDLKDWSNSYNLFQNWTNLNGLMAISSNFETYIATIVSLAIESDPGLLYKSPKSIDGVILLKKEADPLPFEKEIILQFIKGDWNSRSVAFQKFFGHIPREIQNNLGELEKLRILRNKIGHSFGRDIELSRSKEVKEILPMERLSSKRFRKLRKMIWKCVSSTDDYLLKNHIGEFQIVKYYHSISSELKGSTGNKAMTFKKKIGAMGDLSGKVYCKGLIEYYDAL